MTPRERAEEAMAAFDVAFKQSLTSGLSFATLREDLRRLNVTILETSITTAVEEARQEEREACLELASEAQLDCERRAEKWARLGSGVMEATKLQEARGIGELAAAIRARGTTPDAPKDTRIRCGSCRHFKLQECAWAPEPNDDTCPDFTPDAGGKGGG